MKKTTLRLFCLLIIPMILFTVPYHSKAAVQYYSGERVCGDHLTWSLDNEGLLTISGSGDMYSYADHAPWNYFDVKSVVLEDGVTGIGARAFSDCYFLKSVTIPESVTKIGDYAFFRCYRLKSISLPERLCEIGANPFIYCISLNEIILPPNHPVFSFESGMLSSIPERRLICRLQAEQSDQCEIPEGIQIIGDSAFIDCENLRFVTIPEGVSVIANRAFSGCGVLSVRDFPQSLVSVGDYAFTGCKNLGHAQFKEGLVSIGDCAFTYCWYLHRMDLPDTLTHLGKHPFDDCRGLTEIHLSENHSLLGIKNSVLYTKPDMKMIFYIAETPCETFAVPQGISVIGERAFATSSGIRKIILPDSVQEIEREAFWQCDQVEEIVFSNELKVIRDRAFYDMSALKEAILPEGVNLLGDEAFAGCSKLEKVLLPSSVENIGKDLFEGTDKLNLAVFVTEGSVSEAYCRQQNLKVVYPGQDIPEPEVDLPQAFVAQYPDYQGIAEVFAWTDGQTGEAVYLAKDPEGKLVLLCGAMHRKDEWTIIRSTPLPEKTRFVLSDGLEMLDLGFVRCTVRRYYGDTWGIDYTGWRHIYAGPNWIGYYFPTTPYFGKHPWRDLTEINWRTVTEDLRIALKSVDVSAVTITHSDNPDNRIPIYTLPDSGSVIIASMMNQVPLFILEKGSEWTHVSLGRDMNGQWKLEGWIRTEDLQFPEKAEINKPFSTDYLLYPWKNKAATLVTPLGNTEISGFNDLWDTWFVIGETVLNEQEYWLFFECNTEQVGFVLKEELHEPNG